MQEAMLACIDITKPKFEISAAKRATRKFPLIWLCKMANLFLASKVNYWNIDTLLPIPRQGHIDPI